MAGHLSKGKTERVARMRATSASVTPFTSALLVQLRAPGKSRAFSLPRRLGAPVVPARKQALLFPFLLSFPALSRLWSGSLHGFTEGESHGENRIKAGSNPVKKLALQEENP